MKPNWQLLLPKIVQKIALVTLRTIAVVSKLNAEYNYNVLQK